MSLEKFLLYKIFLKIDAEIPSQAQNIFNLILVFTVYIFFYIVSF
jgi:hypothetical protein